MGAELEGRIVALEMLVRGLLTVQAQKQANPIDWAETLGSSLVESMQHTIRPDGDYPDQVMEAAARAIHLECSQVVKRLRYIESQSQG